MKFGAVDKNLKKSEMMKGGVQQQSHQQEGPVGEAAEFEVLPAQDFQKPEQPRRSRPTLSKYERARVLAIRAEQIGRGTMPLVDRLDGDGAAQTAEREFAAGRIPFIIRRYLPNGIAEDWRLEELGACDRRLSHK